MTTKEIEERAAHILYDIEAFDASLRADRKQCWLPAFDALLVTAAPSDEGVELSIQLGAP